MKNRGVYLRLCRKFLGVIAILFILILLNSGSMQRVQAHPGSFADLASDLVPAVVHISMIQEARYEQRFSPMPYMPQFPEGSPFRDFFEEFFRHRLPQKRPHTPRKRSLGSGFIIEPQGLIVTNDHVIEDADQIEVTIANGEKLRAQIVGRDPKTDLALLKVEAKEELPFVSFGNEEDIRVGDWVIAIGNPFGLGGTVTAGIVSGFERNINSGPYDSFIQTDAAINWGNSGGPLFDLDGRVIGVNSKIISPSGGSVGIGFAIPASIATAVIDQLREFGQARRGWLGVRIQTVSEEIAASLGMDVAQGALVSSLMPDSPASEAGIRPGDVILRFAGKKVDQMHDLPRIVAETNADSIVPVKLWRKGNSVSLKVRVGRLDEDVVVADKDSQLLRGEGTDRFLGMKLVQISKTLHQRFDIPSATEGVLVEDVDYSSEAAKKGISAGDVIVQVAQRTVATPGDVFEIAKLARRAGRSAALFLIYSAGSPYFVALHLAE